MDQQGFTLIEVLVAMIILAVGLLGLEALSIGAARSISLASKQSRFATVASDSLESALSQLRAGQLPTAFCTDLPPGGEKLSRAVSVATPTLPVVTVSVVPNSGAAVVARPYVLRSSLYLPTPANGSVSGQPCS